MKAENRKTVAAISEEMEVMRRRVDAVDSQTLRIQSDVRQLGRDLERGVAEVREHKVTAMLDSLEDRVTNLAKLVQISILKLNVCSEVSRIYPEIWPAIVSALDHGDEWWSAGASMTIAQWRTRLAEAGRQVTRDLPIQSLLQ